MMFIYNMFIFKRKELNTVFVCHRTISMAAVYQLKIRCDQDKFGVIFLDAKCPVSFPLENKYVVNEHRVVRKSHDATQKECSHALPFNVPRDWFERNSQHQKLYSEGSKKIVGVAVCWEE